jgi:3,4-dihydroxy-2-butanone 4-phosphate synthase
MATALIIKMYIKIRDQKNKELQMPGHFQLISALNALNMKGCASAQVECNC